MQEDLPFLEKVDWLEMPIYTHYLDANSRNTSLVKYLTSIYTEIYSDLEINYTISLLTQQVPENETQKRNSVQVASRYFEKTFATLQVLMKMLGVEYHFQRISKKYKNSITLHSLLVLMSRCRKLYSALHHLATIFRLVNKKIASEEVEPLLDDRLRCSIKGFFNEHTLLPLKFIFGGVDILQLVRKRK